jgi:hypothetical protein
VRPIGTQTHEEADAALFRDLVGALILRPT